MDPARPDEPPAASPAPAPPRRAVTPRQYLWIVGAAAVLVLALEFLGPVLTPFLVGAIFAYIGAPLVDPLLEARYLDIEQGAIAARPAFAQRRRHAGMQGGQHDGHRGKRGAQQQQASRADGHSAGPRPLRHSSAVTTTRCTR